MTDTFSPPRNPSLNGTQGATAMRALSVKFGDGYRQDQADGVNPWERTYTLQWEFLSAAEAWAVTTFLEAHVGTAFYYTLPHEIAPRTWVCTGIQRSHPMPTYQSMTVTLEERFLNV